MAENRALSQGEIDALLNQIPEGGESESDGTMPASTPLDTGFSRVIKAYDFRRPDKFSKEQWGTLQSMYEAFSRFAGAGSRPTVPDFLTRSRIHPGKHSVAQRCVAVESA